VRAATDWHCGAVTKAILLVVSGIALLVIGAVLTLVGVMSMGDGAALAIVGLGTVVGGTWLLYVGVVALRRRAARAAPNQ